VKPKIMIDLVFAEPGDEKQANDIITMAYHKCSMSQ